MWAAGVAVRPILMASKWSSVLRQIDMLLGRVAAVALVGDDQVEGMDRDVELLGVVVDRLVAERQRRLAAEQVDRHALDRADVDEGVARASGR